MTIVVLGAITAVILGLKRHVDFGGSVCGRARSECFCTNLCSMGRFSDYRWLCVRNRTLLDSLYAIRNELECAHAAGEINKEKLDNLFIRWRGALEDQNREWLARRGKNGEKGQGGFT